MTLAHVVEDLPEPSPPSLSEPPPPMEALGLRPGDLVADRYEIIRKLGEGATASVYLARHRLINRSVALKIVHADVKRDAGLMQRFLNEGRAVGSMGHPHIVESTDMGYLPSGEPFLVLEYLEGRDLADEVAASGALDLRRALGIVRQCASALGAAHGHGIIHRDLKAENVFLVQKVGKSDHAKILDFGISKFASASDKTAAGVIFGTVEYLSPEQVGATNAVDARTDVYSLGVVLYHALTAHFPFENHEFPAVLRAIVVDPPHPMTAWRPDLPVAVCELVERCLKKRPEDRYQTMAELEAALSSLLESAWVPSLVSSGSMPAVADDTPPSLRSGAFMRPSPPSVIPLTGVPTQQIQVVTDPRGVAPSALKRWLGVAALAVVAVGTAVGIGRQVGVERAQAGVAPTAPSAVKLAVSGPDGVITFRGREHILPYEDEVKTSTERERIDVKVGSETRTVWLVIDRPRHVVVGPR